MPIYSFPCPHCSTRLRLQDRRLIGRTIDCPDCHQAVELRDDHGSGVIGSQARRADSAQHTRRTTDDMPRGGRKWLTFAGSPLGAAWLVAAGLSTGLLSWLVLSPAARHSPQSEGGPNQFPRSKSLDAALVASSPMPEDGTEPPADDPVERRLRGLFGRLSAQQAQTGGWPRGTRESRSVPVGSRFSWLAELAARSDANGPHPHWDRAWNDPLNERFVRRRQDAFLNPAVESETGNDRYPASHFVGVSGHGTDSELLPGGHPRAGIFGNNRATSADDVPDGLAHTMLLAGVDRHLGSWAAAGPSTLRGFTAEPYVNGPDGFGTGQADGMFVLMADGSVRFLASNVDPVIVRRMAAKADGLPLDASVPGVPALGQQPIPQENSTPTEGGAVDKQTAETVTPPNRDGNPFEIADLVAELAGGAERPIEVPLAGEAEATGNDEHIDVAAALRQPIAMFDQSTPVPARRLLRAIEEMTSVRMDFDRLAGSRRNRLDQPVSVTLTETTVGDILFAVLAQLELRYEVRGDRLSISERETVK